MFITICINCNKLKFGFRINELQNNALIWIINKFEPLGYLKHPDNVLVSNKFVDLLTVSSK